MRTTTWLRQSLLSAGAALLCACDTSFTEPACILNCSSTRSRTSGNGVGTKFTGYAVYPVDARILLGDTATYNAARCGAYEFSCGSTGGNAVSDWSIPDGAVIALASQGGTTARAMSIVVRGVALGQSQFTAKPEGSVDTRTMTVTVVDSSEVAKIELSGGTPDSLPVWDVGRPIIAQLRSAGEVAIRGRPTAWWVSDTTVARLAAPTHVDGSERRALVPMTPGTVEVRVTFRDIVSTVRFTVR